MINSSQNKNIEIDSPSNNMDKIIQAVLLEAEAIYQTRLKPTLITAGLVVLGLVFFIVYSNNNHQNFWGTDVNYKIDIEREYSESSQKFFATNNQIEQIYSDVLKQDQEEIGEAVAFANENLMAVSSLDENELMTVQILKNKNGQWQESYSFSYETASTTNHEIPDTEIPTDSDDLLFGASLSFYGNNVLVIGAPGWQGPAIEDNTDTTDVYEGDDGTNRGSVYVFQYNGSTWVLTSTIRGFEPQAHFGSAVDFSPMGILAIGAKSGTYVACPSNYSDTDHVVPSDEDEDGDGNIDEDDTKTISRIAIACAAVHFYESDSIQSISQWNKIDTISTNIAPGGSFGNSVAFADDNLIAIGARLQQAPNRVSGEGYTRRPGAVHLYAKNSDADWTKELVISDFNTTNPGSGKYQIELEDLDGFGQSVSFFGTDTLVASALYKGTLYVLQKSNNSWEQITTIEGHKLLAGNPLGISTLNERALSFGHAINVYGDTIAVTHTSDHHNHLLAQGVINLLDLTTFLPETTWHYTYINDANCDANDFLNSPIAYTEGDSITPPGDKEGQRLCFKADSGSEGIEYFASSIIDSSVPQFSTPSLTISEDGVLSIYFNEKIRQIDDGEIDEDWVQTNVGSLDITLHGQTTSVTITLNHENVSSEINSGNSMVSVEHINDRTILKVQIDTANSNFPPATEPSATAPHTYEISLVNFEDSADNAQLTALTAEQEIADYADSTPIITITVGDDQSINTADNLADGESILQYVWLNQSEACDSTTSFNAATTYTENDSIRLEESHNGQQICFKATNGTDSSLTNYKAYQVDGVDRSAPIIDVNLTTTSISATDADTDTTTWAYVILDSNSCDSTTDFSSADTYSEEGAILAVDETDSTQANKYYCFKSTDNQNNIGYKSSSQIAGSPTIQKITLSNEGQNLFGIGGNLAFYIHFDEPVIYNGTERSIYLHVNSQTDPNNLNAYKENTSDLQNGVLSLRYVVLGGDSTSNLQIVEIILADGTTIRDADGNDAILDLSGLTLLDKNDQARIVEIDGFKPTITLTQPSNMSAWGIEKVVSAIDDEDNNDANWDYHFINAEAIGNDPHGQSLEIRCYLGDFLPSNDIGIPYNEGDEIILTEENNNHYICFRSRRPQPELWDILNRDRAGVVSDLIQNIDNTLPAVALDNKNEQITAAANDLGGSGLRPDSLVYKMVNAAEDCIESTFDSGTTIYEGPIEITSAEKGKYFCFKVEDLVGNKSYANIVALERPSNNRRPDNRPPNIEVTNPDTEPATYKVVSATSDSSDVEDSSWRRKIYDSNTENCDSKLIAYDASPYTAGEEIILDDEMYNGQSICFSVSDDDGNTAYASSEVIEGIDRTAPSIVITIDDNELIAIDDDEDETYWRYKIIEEYIDCNLEALENAQTYVEGNAISLTDHENYKICFEIKDKLGNTNYQDSSVFIITQDVSTLNLDVSLEDEKPADEAEEDSPTIHPAPTQPEPADEEPDEESTEEDNTDQESNNISSWLLLSGLLLLLIIFFIIKRRKDKDDE